MSNEQLLFKIEQKRAELIEIVCKYGLNASKTIKISQDLDSLLNQYNLAEKKVKSLSNS
ncbi:Spo0E family sporulation regulatory protein-aspartic acid phosphatase [Fredinandcohnia humi]